MWKKSTADNVDFAVQAAQRAAKKQMEEGFAIMAARNATTQRSKTMEQKKEMVDNNAKVGKRHPNDHLILLLAELLFLCATALTANEGGVLR